MSRLLPLTKEEAPAALKRAAKRYGDAKVSRDEAIREAAAAGMTRRAIAEIVGVSHQRVQQIIQDR